MAWSRIFLFCLFLGWTAAYHVCDYPARLLEPSPLWFSDTPLIISWGPTDGLVNMSTPLEVSQNGTSVILGSLTYSLMDNVTSTFLNVTLTRHLKVRLTNQRYDLSCVVDAGPTLLMQMQMAGVVDSIPITVALAIAFLCTWCLTRNKRSF